MRERPAYSLSIGSYCQMHNIYNGNCHAADHTCLKGAAISSQTRYGEVKPTIQISSISTSIIVGDGTVCWAHSRSSMHWNLVCSNGSTGRRATLQRTHNRRRAADSAANEWRKIIIVRGSRTLPTMVVRFSTRGTKKTKKTQSLLLSSNVDNITIVKPIRSKYCNFKCDCFFSHTVKNDNIYVPVWIKPLGL